MPLVEFEGKSYTVSESGFLVNLGDWDDGWMKYVMLQEGIKELTDDHKKVVSFIQIYYRENGIAPTLRLLTKDNGFKLTYLYELFPSGPAKGACKMAGLPKSTGCI